MSLIDRVIAGISPHRALRRAAARAALLHYQSSDLHRRAPSVRANGGDADAAAQGARSTLAWISRDVARNNPTATRALSVIVNNVVGAGIEPRLITTDTGLQREWRDVVAPRLDSLALDQAGMLPLGGLQALALETIARDGEVLVVWPDLETSGAKIRVLEPDYLDDRMQGARAAGNGVIYDGIEYDDDGSVAAYHLFDQHPGSPILWPGQRGLTSSRVDAGRVLHIFRVDRPGQRRGVSWFAPVMDDLVALAENDTAQLMRQKIAACFAAFWRTEKPSPGIPTTLAPGLIQQIGADDEVSFANPPDVQGYDDFARVHLRRVAVGLGITYEDLTGDLSTVNFSSARLGRITMGQNIDRWQWHLMIPRMCRPMGTWLLRQWAYDHRSDPALVRALSRALMDWTPPPPVIADPKTETDVSVRRIEAGLASRHGEIRRLGYTPESIDPEIAADMALRRDLAALKQPGAAPQIAESNDPQSIEKGNTDA